MKEKIVKNSIGLSTTPIFLFRPLCWLLGVVRSFPWIGEGISGHNFVVTTPFTDAEVEVLTCEDCGKESIGWIKKK